MLLLVQNQAAQVSPSPSPLPSPSLRVSFSEVVLTNRPHIGSKTQVGDCPVIILELPFGGICAESNL